MRAAQLGALPPARDSEAAPPRILSRRALGPRKPAERPRGPAQPHDSAPGGSWDRGAEQQERGSGCGPRPAPRPAHPAAAWGRPGTRSNSGGWAYCLRCPGHGHSMRGAGRSRRLRSLRAAQEVPPASASPAPARRLRRHKGASRKRLCLPGCAAPAPLPFPSLRRLRICCGVRTLS